jgi:hypothetical protein
MRVVGDGHGQFLAVGHPHHDSAAGQSPEVDTDDVLFGGTVGHWWAFLTNVSGHNCGCRLECGQGAAGLDPKAEVSKLLAIRMPRVAGDSECCGVM